MASSKRAVPGAKSKTATRAARRSTDVPTAAEVPITRAMLGELRTELLERIAQSEDKFEARFHEIKSELHGLRSELHGLRSELHEVKADIHELKAGMARILLLIEEQNARNKVVLDGLVAVMARQERMELRLDGVEATVRSLAATHQ